jgi:hypothetical protein
MQGPEILIPITFFLTVGGVIASRGEIGKAIAHRIRGGAARDEDLKLEVDEMRRELDAVRMELAETNERLDFTERLLSSGRQEGIGRGAPD